MKKLIKNLQKEVSAALKAADASTDNRISDAFADFIEDICYDLEKPLMVESNLKGYHYFSCYIGADENHPDAAPCLYLSVDYGKFFYPGCDDTNFTPDTEILYRIAATKEGCKQSKNQYVKLSQLKEIINDFYMSTIKPLIETEDGNMIFNLKNARCTTEELSQIIYGVYLSDSEVGMDEFLQYVEIHGATVNEVAYIFARLHELSDGDASWIDIEGTPCQLTCYLP